MNVKAFPSRRQQICSWALSAGQMIDPASKSKQKDGRIFFFSRSLRHTATAKTNNQSKNGRIIFFFFFLSRLSTASRPDGCAQTWKEIVVFTETDVVLFWMQQSGYRRYTGKRKWNGRDAVNGRRKRLRRSGPRLLNSPPETYSVYTHTVEREQSTTWTKWVGETEEEDGGGLTTFGKKMSTTPGTGFQMVAPRAMEALQWPVKMLNGRMLNNPVPPPPPVASGVVKPPPPEEEDEALAVRETTANMATAAKRKRESDGPGILRFFLYFSCWPIESRV